MTAQKREFKTEVQQLLDLVVHSLYSNKDIFLRELISNASDAIDRIRFDALSNKDLIGKNDDWKIKIEADKEARTITITDNGIGMNLEDVENNIGTIANSGTRKFMEQLKESKEALTPELIGQFGVGFYSSFMVADKVTLVTRRADAKPEEAILWSSEGDGSYTVETTTKETRGTTITLHMTEGMDEYLEEWKIRKIVKQFSNFVEHPVVMDITREEAPLDDDGKPIQDGEKVKVTKEEVLNSQKAIWQRASNEVTDEEYNEFYKHLSHDFQDPIKTIHWKVEGMTEFRALIYLPKKAMMQMFQTDNKKHGVQLYVKRVFITDNCEALLPPYLNFLHGVVDSSDLPLNISREILQENKLIRKIQKNLVKKVLNTLDKMKENEREKYVEFWNDFGSILKQGVHIDFENREKIQNLLLFQTDKTEPGKYSTMKEYVERMPEEQKEIYYIIGEDRKTLENSPHMELLRSKGYEVIFMIDPIDEWVVQSMNKYDEKSLKAIDRGDLDLATEEEKKEKTEALEKAQAEYKDLIELIQEKLNEKIKEVKLSKRLTESACCLVEDEFAMGKNMERIMKAMHQDVPASKRILEINPEHELITTMQAIFAKDKTNPKLTEYSQMLYDQGLITAGLPVEDPLAFAKRVSNLMAIEGKSLL